MLEHSLCHAIHAKGFLRSMKAEEQQVVLEGKTDNPLDLKNQQHADGDANMCFAPAQRDFLKLALTKNAALEGHWPEQAKYSMRQLDPQM